MTAMEMRAMDAVENQAQVSHGGHSPWKSNSTIPTFPPPRRLFPLTKIDKPQKNWCSVEKWKSKSTIPDFPTEPKACGARKEPVYGVVSPVGNTRRPEGGLSAGLLVLQAHCSMRICSDTRAQAL